MDSTSQILAAIVALVTVIGSVWAIVSGVMNGIYKRISRDIELITARINSVDQRLTDMSGRMKDEFVPRHEVDHRFFSVYEKMEDIRSAIRKGEEDREA